MIEQSGMEFGSSYTDRLEQSELRDFEERHRMEDHPADRQYRVLVGSHRSGTTQLS